MRTSVVISGVVAAALAGAALSQQVEGVVERARGATVTIRLSGGAAVVGDAVRLNDEIEGVGRVHLKGTWTVTHVDGARVVAEPDGADVGAPQAGMRAVVTRKAGGGGTPQKPIPLPPPPPPIPGKSSPRNREATAEMDAAIRNDVDGTRMRRLIAAGADVNAADEHGYTVLMKAARSAHVEVLNALLDGGAALDARVREAKSAGEVGQTALMEAVSVRNRQNVAAILARKPSLNVQREDGDTALMIAVRNGDDATTRLLLSAGASLAPVNEMQETATLISLDHKSPRLFEILDEARSKPGASAEPDGVPTWEWVVRTPASGRFSLRLPPAYAEAATSSESIKLLYDTSRTDGAAVRVVRVSFVTVPEGQTLAARREARIAELRSQFENLRAKSPLDARITGGAATVFRYTYDWQGAAVEAVTYIILLHGGAYEITFACHADQFDGLRAEFRAILRTFRFE